MIDRAEDKGSSIIVSDHMAGNLSLSSLKSFIGKVFESKTSSIVGGSLLGISDPKGYVV